MIQFYSSYDVHVQRLLAFYNKAAQYIDYAFTQMSYTDEEKAQMIIDYLDSGK